jgi:hypothetical protein
VTNRKSYDNFYNVVFAFGLNWREMRIKNRERYEDASPLCPELEFLNSLWGLGTEKE